MSEIINSGFAKPECGEMYRFPSIRDVLGGLVNLQIVGTHPEAVGPIDGSAMGDDFEPDMGTLNPDGTFFITIETDGATYVVVLADGTQFTITAAQSSAYYGQWYPARIIKVIKDGTTGSFSVGY